MSELLIATKNRNKAHEFAAALNDKQLQIKTLLDYPNFPEIAETGLTFSENAHLKVAAVIKELNIPTLADDSGLMVDYLHGQPGVRSARYAGDHNDAANNAKLLAELAGVPLEQRQAQFVTTIVYCNPNTNQEIEVVGQLTGQILPVPRGNNGFGYDPLFYVPSLNKSLAQLTMEQKNRISHRGQAIKKFVAEYQKLK
ncbi:non-canonical purine NTP pyrophosphatase [Bombilactobacillus bombi]|uniref:dITP/XTP pyrophosphatase n=1 Tax=Bombilactobacillus bombi TaxID=1303590 RepID=A0A417ZIG8_9LACO|nr:XTP/dITP diphosphatase [Bombilactobacillus bombi]RHW51779.1 non-canonical purine NTP pyrophosphatase [Bombilactobacillus bombi]